MLNVRRASIIGADMAKKLILFVHGLGGDGRVTWADIPDLINNDPDLHDYDTNFFNYPTSLFSFP